MLCAHFKPIFPGSTLGGVLEAAGFYNAALCRCGNDTEQRKAVVSALRDVEYSILGQHDRKRTKDLLTTVPKRNPVDSAKRHKDAIQKVRDFTAKQVLRIQMIWAGMTPGDDKTVLRRQENEVKKECLSLKKKIKMDMRIVLVDMVKECVDAMGPAPCLYAVVVLGDFATEEFTPYTDLEFMVLIDEESSKIVEYFQRFVVYLQFKVLNLGETPPSASGIKTMNDIYFPALNAVFDPYALNGIKIDVTKGITRIKELCSINEMDDDNFSAIPIRKAQNVLKPLTQLLLADGGPITFSILQATVIFGDSELLQQVKHDISTQYFQVPEQRLQLCRAIVENELEIFTTRPLFQYNIFMLDLVDLQKELALCHYLIQVLHVLYGLQASVPIRLLEEMHSRLLLSEVGEHDLKIALSIAYVLRCSLHSSARSQNTSLGLLLPSRHNADRQEYQRLHDIFTFRRCSSLVRFYSAILPLVEHFRKTLNDGAISNLNGADFMKDNLRTKFHAYIRSVRLHDATSILKQIIKQLITSEQDTMTPELYDTCNDLGILLLQCRDTNGARRYFTKALKMKDHITDEFGKSLVFVTCWYHYGLVYLVGDQFKKAESYFKECIAMFDKMVKTRSRNVTYLTELCSIQVSVHESMSVLYSRMGCNLDSLGHIQISLDYFDKLDYQSPHRKMLLMYAAGCANLMQTDYDASHYYFKNALAECEVVCGKHRPSTYAGFILFNMGQANEGLGKTPQSRMYRAAALDLFRRVLGEASRIGTIGVNPISVPVEHRHMVNCALTAYVDCCMAVKDYDSAAVLLEKCPPLTSTKERDSSVLTLETTTNMLRKGTCLLKMKKAEPGMEVLLVALDAYRELFQRKQHTYYTIACRRLIAVALMQQDMLEDAMHELKLVISDVRDKLPENDTPLLLQICLEDQACIYSSRNEYDHALSIWQNILESRKHIFSSTHPMVALANREIGRLHRIMCDFDSAADNFIIAVGILQRLFGDSTPSVELVEVCLDLSIAYQEGKRTAMAESMLLKTTHLWSELDTICLGHPENVRSKIVMGNFYRKTNRLQQACQWHKKALCTCLVGNCSNMQCNIHELIVNIAVDYRMANMHKECIQFYEAAIAFHRAVHSKDGDTMDIADWLVDMAVVYEALKNKAKAEECRLVSGNIKLSILGEECDEKEPASSLSLLAEHFEQRGQFQRAIPLRRKALIQAKSDHGSDPHVEVIQCYRSLIDTYLKIGFYDQANRKNNDLLTLFKRKYGNGIDHADIATTHRTTGYINHGMSKFDASKVKYEQSLSMYTRLGVDKHCNDVVLCLTELAKCLLTIGEKSRAESHLMRAKEICSKARKSEPCRADVEGTMYMILGWSCEAFPNFENALSHYKKAQKLLFRAFGQSAHNMQIAQCLCAMGRTQCVLNKYEAGIINLDKSVDMMHIVYGDGPLDRPDVFNAYCDLAKAHLKGGDPALSLEYYTKVFHAMKQKSGSDQPSLQIAKHIGYVAHAAHKAREYETAVKHALESAGIYIQVLKKHSTHPDTVAMMTLAGDIYMDMGQTEKALRQYKDAAHMVLLLHNGNALSKEVERAMIKVRKARLAVEVNAK